MRLPTFLLIVLAALLTATVSSHEQHKPTLQAGGGRGEVVEVDEEVAWVVQLSDLHFSRYHADRARSFSSLLGPLLSFIKPSLVLISGDLTDAKSKDRTSRRQDEAEWVEYSQTIRKVMHESGIPPYAFFDVRGNHDKFGVPEVGGALDYYSKYSISALRNRTSNIQSVTLMNRGWKHLFVGVDTSMEIGLRGPCNLFGHPTDEQLDFLDLELSQWDSCVPERVTKTVFGHFPLSFTASTKTGRRLEPLFAKHSISAYVCGHLHTTFGSNLIKHHLHTAGGSGTLHSCKQEVRDEYGEFWEWEIGDWRKSRMLRILAIDQGHVSFVDFEVSSLNTSISPSRDQLPTLIVPTYPLDSQKMKRLNPHPLSSSSQDSVRALVFSPQPLISVVARFYNSCAKPLVLVEELEMHISSRVFETGFMYASSWNSFKYMDPSLTHYMYQIVAVDSAGKETKSIMRAFSTSRGVGRLKHTWRELLLMGTVFEDVLGILVWSAFSVLVGTLVISKIYFSFLVKSGRYSRWVFSLFRADTKWKFTSWKAAELCAWFLVQGSADEALWWGMLLTLVYLMFFPWFWGQALAEGYPLGLMSVRGWTVRLGPNSPWRAGLGWPDLMVVVLPYLYFVILPLYVLIFALSAEGVRHKALVVDAAAVDGKKEETDASGNNKKKGPTTVRWLRMVILAGCLWVAFIHLGQTCALAGSYGVMALVASPGVAWPVPVLLIMAVVQATGCRRRK